MHRLTHFSISKANLLKLPERELAIVLGGGKILNELNILSKHVKFAVNGLASRTQLDFDSAATMTLAVTFHRILCGHVFEAHQFFRKNVRVDLMRSSTLLGDDIRTDIKEVNRYFAKTPNVIAEVRNRFAFHTDATVLNETLASSPFHLTYDVIFGDWSGNNLIYGSENMMFERLEQLYPERTSEEMVGLIFYEPTRIAFLLSRIFQKLIGAVMVEYLGLTIEDAAVEEVSNGPALESVLIPFFVSKPEGVDWT